MREARWAASQKPSSDTSPTRTSRAAARPKTAPATSPASRTAKVEAAPADAPAAPDASAAACGHRSMNGRTCTRPAGHPEKNHRYS